jgi:hypothetical protein
MTAAHTTSSSTSRCKQLFATLCLILLPYAVYFVATLLVTVNDPLPVVTGVYAAEIGALIAAQ